MKTSGVWILLAGIIFFSVHAEENRFALGDWIIQQDSLITHDPSNPVLSNPYLGIQDFYFYESGAEFGTNPEFILNRRLPYVSIPLRYAPGWARGLNLAATIPFITGKEYWDSDEREEKKRFGLGDISLRIFYGGILPNSLFISGGLSVSLPTGEDFLLGHGTTGFSGRLSGVYPVPDGIVTAAVSYSWKRAYEWSGDGDEVYDPFDYTYPGVLSVTPGYKRHMWDGLSVGILTKFTLVDAGDHEIISDIVGTDYRSDNLFLVDMTPLFSYDDIESAFWQSVYARVHIPLMENSDDVDRDVSFHLGSDFIF
ncbi:MAG: hypothetical protein ACQEQ4_04280 [Fibrobacterota bacterium]